MALTHHAQVSTADRRAWAAHFKALGQAVAWTDGKTGVGAPNLKAQLARVSEGINAKRARRGLQVGCPHAPPSPGDHGKHECEA